MNAWQRAVGQEVTWEHWRWMRIPAVKVAYFEANDWFGWPEGAD